MKPGDLVISSENINEEMFENGDEMDPDFFVGTNTWQCNTLALVLQIVEGKPYPKVKLLHTNGVGWTWLDYIRKIP